MKAKKTNRVGEISTNNQGLTMEIVKYNNNKDIEIVFLETGEKKVVRYVNFCRGTVKADLVKYPYLVVAKTKIAAKWIKRTLFIAILTAAATALLTRII